MPSSTVAFFERSRQALATTQVALGAMLGVSRRTAQRWSERGVPGSELQELARLVYPRDAGLAGEIAAAMGTTLEALGIVAPPPPPALSPPPLPPPPPPLPPPPPPPPDGVVDAVVCAASEASGLDAPRRARRPAPPRSRAPRRSWLTVEMVERALRAKLPAPPAPPEEPKREPQADKRKGGRG